MKDLNDERDMMEAEIWTITQTEQGNAVLLQPLGAEEVIPIFIGPLEAQSILIGFDHILTERPLTHDLILTLMKQTGFAMLKVEISDLKDNIFYGRVWFHRPNQPAQAPLVLDARPSDALALAVRAGCPILTARKVLKQAGIMPGIIIDFPEIDLSGQEPSVKNTEKKAEWETPQSLRQELDRAVEAEEYEQAAKIRDKLIFLAKGKKRSV
ncbi:MAG: bifunctional nuclease family protein [Treponema sp.]|jgi:bifunctional DNase/RNase|nr:bifunctional nuclease family protein [Treponema sp.]